MRFPLGFALLLVALSACQTLALAPRHNAGLVFPTETYVLDNGMRVTLHPDRSLPKVVINTWFGVGSKDEAPGRTGFAHLFEHLMFMGTGRVPDNQFDVLMERGGGSNNASTSSDRTNYFSMGPASLLPTLLWLDADRLDALDDHMTQEKLDKQRAVVRNERRQTSENVPYGKAELRIPEALYPEGHPYHHPVIGSHADLEAATVEDVVEFFRLHYVPSNASLVVAGDFEPGPVKALIARTFGAIPARSDPPRRVVPPVRLEGLVRLVETDQVEFPKLFLAWHSPAYYAPGDGEMDLAAAILAGGPSSRLVQRLVLERGLAQSVDAYQASGELGSSFRIEALAAPDVTLDELAAEIQTVLDEFLEQGPSAQELASVQAAREADFLQSIEGLFQRADQMNAYLRYFGFADGFQRDLERWTRPTPTDVRTVCRDVLGPERVELRVLPEPEAPVSLLDERPADFPPQAFQPPRASELRLSNGLRVLALPRPGTRLVRGALLFAGGESLFAAADAGHAELFARLANSGAGGLDAGAFAQSVESLGASMQAGAGREFLTYSWSGLTSRLDATLAKLADLVRHPNLEEDDFVRERGLALASLQARGDNPSAVASSVARRLVFGDGRRGRPLSGTRPALEAATLADLLAARHPLVDPAQATFVIAGDFGEAELAPRIERHFGDWRFPGTTVQGRLPVETEVPTGRLVLVDRPDAPQTVIYALRPVPPAEGVTAAAREAVDTILGGTFTSRLNANLREDKGYTYGARSALRREGEQHLMLASSAVFTQVTGAALAEFKGEFDRLRADGVRADELEKALETQRRRLVETAETTGSATEALASLVQDGRPLDSLARELAALDGVGLGLANELARSELYDWSHLTVVLVGDKRLLLPQLEAHGFTISLEVDKDGEPVQ